MSYIPKYILKRMLPMDCVKKVEGGIEITMINVLSPIEASAIPEDITGFISAKIDGTDVPSELFRGLVVTFNGEKYDASSLVTLNGQTLPVGGTLTFFVPYEDVQAGEEHELSIDIKETDFHFTISRVVQ